jgi:hypothetical protein
VVDRRRRSDLRGRRVVQAGAGACIRSCRGAVTDRLVHSTRGSRAASDGAGVDGSACDALERADRDGDPADRESHRGLAGGSRWRGSASDDERPRADARVVLPRLRHHAVRHHVARLDLDRSPPGSTVAGARVDGMPESQSPEPRAQSPEPRAQSPEPGAQSPEPGAQSPEPKAQSPSRGVYFRRLQRFLAAHLPRRDPWARNDLLDGNS